MRMPLFNSALTSRAARSRRPMFRSPPPKLPHRLHPRHQPRRRHGPLRPRPTPQINPSRPTVHTHLAPQARMDPHQVGLNRPRPPRRQPISRRPQHRHCRQPLSDGRPGHLPRTAGGTPPQPPLLPAERVLAERRQHLIVGVSIGAGGPPRRSHHVDCPGGEVDPVPRA